MVVTYRKKGKATNWPSKYVVDFYLPWKFLLWAFKGHVSMENCVKRNLYQMLKRVWKLMLLRKNSNNSTFLGLGQLRTESTK